MKKIIIIALFTFILISCKETKDSNLKAEPVNIENLTIGPTVHESLNEKQLEQIKYIHQEFIEVYPISFDETITNFKRDKNPDFEINIWLNMVSAFQPFALKNQEQERLEARKEAFKLILFRSMMSEREAISASEIKILSRIEIQEILKSYKLDIKPFKVEIK